MDPLLLNNTYNERITEYVKAQLSGSLVLPGSRLGRTEQAPRGLLLAISSDITF